MKKYYISLVLLSLLFVSCDDLEQTVNYQLPYVEKLVIQGEFGIQNDGFSVLVTKTLPPLEQVTLDKVTIKDAECKVYFKDTVVDLVYSNFSRYTNSPGLRLEEGVEYKLVVKWKDKIATATSTIPRLPIIKSVEKVLSFDGYGGSNIFIWMGIEAKDKGMVSMDNAEDRYEYHGNLKLINQIGKIDTVGYVDYIYPNDEDTTSTFILKFYDIAYYPYYISRNEGESESGIFSGGGLNIEGNVEGKNTIGVWVGYNQLIDSVDKYLIKK